MLELDELELDTTLLDDELEELTTLELALELEELTELTLLEELEELDELLEATEELEPTPAALPRTSNSNSE